MGALRQGARPEKTVREMYGEVRAVASPLPVMLVTLPPLNVDAVSPTGRTAEGDAHPARWRALVLLSIAELLGMSLWFAATAVAPQLR